MRYVSNVHNTARSKFPIERLSKKLEHVTRGGYLRCVKNPALLSLRECCRRAVDVGFEMIFERDRYNILDLMRIPSDLLSMLQ